MKNAQQYRATATAALETLKMRIHLEAFGETLAEQNGYKDIADGMEAIYLYLMNKHHWPLSQIRTMSTDDLRDSLSQEMQSWLLPKEHPAREVLAMIQYL